VLERWEFQFCKSALGEQSVAGEILLRSVRFFTFRRFLRLAIAEISIAKKVALKRPSRHRIGGYLTNLPKPPQNPLQPQKNSPPIAPDTTSAMGGLTLQRFYLGAMGEIYFFFNPSLTRSSDAFISGLASRNSASFLRASEIRSLSALISSLVEK
jgi:hypothetical protein